MVNTDYWNPKLARNVERDVQANEALSAAGWEVVRLWEHETLDVMVRCVTERSEPATPRAVVPGHRGTH